MATATLDPSSRINEPFCTKPKAPAEREREIILQYVHNMLQCTEDVCIRTLMDSNSKTDIKRVYQRTTAKKKQFTLADGIHDNNTTGPNSASSKYLPPLGVVVN